MARKSLVAVLASVGIVYSGVVTPDLVAFAGAIQKQDHLALFEFVSKHPESAFVPDAIMIASEQCRQEPHQRRHLMWKYDDCVGTSNDVPDQTPSVPAPSSTGQGSGRSNGGGGTGKGGGFDGGTSV